MKVRARSVLAGLALSALISGCGGAAAPAPTPTPTPTPTVSPSPAPTAAATATVGPGAISFIVDSSSKAVVSVREQLARLPLPSDAVLTFTGVTGTFALNPDGTFASTSKITADLGTLSSDQRQRDDFIKRVPLEVTRFPRAEFAPTTTTGLTLPLPASGDFKFKLTGNMTVRGVTKETTFAVTASRAGTKLTATATAEPTWKFADFGMKPPSVFTVLSIVDEIRMELSLIATETR